jgi:hypothetical protein
MNLSASTLALGKGCTSGMDTSRKFACGLIAGARMLAHVLGYSPCHFSCPIIVSYPHCQHPYTCHRPCLPKPI